MNNRKIELQERDEDGYWIYLTKGWQDSFNPGCHIITEDTRKEALQKVRWAIKCNCKNCKEG